MIIFDEEEQYLKLQKSGFDKFINTKDLTILAKHYLHIDKIPLSEIRVKLVTFVTNFNPNFRPIKYEKQLTNAINLAVANYQIYNPLISFSQNEMDYIRDKDLTLWEQKLLFVICSLSKWQQHPYIYLNSDSVIQIRDLRIILGLNLKDCDILSLLHSLVIKGKIKVNLKPLLKVEVLCYEDTLDKPILFFKIKDDLGLQFDQFIGEKVFKCECCGKLFKPTGKARFAKYCKFCVKKEN